MSNKPLEESFALLLGRAPTGEEREQLFRVKTALGLADNDALWLVLMALEYYRGLYEKLPGELEKASRELIENLRATASTTVGTSLESARADLTKAVIAAAEQMAGRTAERNYVQWVAGSIVAACLCVAVLAYVIYVTASRLAYDGGYQAGYTAARDEKAWGNSEDGKLSRLMARDGVLGLVSRCDAPGWTIKNGYCYPGPHEGQVYGWRLPKEGQSDESAIPQRSSPAHSSIGR